MAYVSPSLPFLLRFNPLLTFRPFLSLFAEVMGRLDHLVEAVFERFRDRYFKGESTFLLLKLSLWT